MRFTSAAILAFASLVFAQTDGFDVITQPAEHSTLQAGEDFEIVWEPTDDYKGTVTITLIGGPAQKSQDDIEVIAKSIDNSLGSYEWSVGSDLGAFAIYGLRITLDSDKNIFQYSFPFQITPASGSSNSSSSGTGSPSSTSGSDTASASATASHKPITTAATYTVGSNSTATGGPSQTDVTITTTPTATTTGSPTTIPSNPAGTVAASSFALVGGLAMAIFAL